MNSKKMSQAEVEKSLKLATLALRKAAKIQAQGLTPDAIAELKNQAFKARNEVAESHFGIVTHFARLFCKKYACHFLLDEIIDVGKDALVDAVKEYQIGHDSRAKFETFAFVKVKWAIQNYLQLKETQIRLRQSELEQVSTSYDINARSPEEEYAKREWERIIRNEISKLPEQQRKVCTLRYMMDHSVDETAKILGISEGAVKTYSSIAREKLRTALSDRGLIRQ